MAVGDWSANCKLRPTYLALQFDNASPPNITSIDVNYLVVQPSGSEVAKDYVYIPAAPVPISQGLTAIQDSIKAAMAYEGLGVG